MGPSSNFSKPGSFVQPIDQRHRANQEKKILKT
jgi:hypothetical protein